MLKFAPVETDPLAEVHQWHGIWDQRSKRKELTPRFAKAAKAVGRAIAAIESARAAIRQLEATERRHESRLIDRMQIDPKDSRIQATLALIERWCAEDKKAHPEYFEPDGRAHGLRERYLDDATLRLQTLQGHLVEEPLQWRKRSAGREQHPLTGVCVHASRRYDELHREALRRGDEDRRSVERDRNRWIAKQLIAEGIEPEVELAVLTKRVASILSRKSIET